MGICVRVCVCECVCLCLKLRVISSAYAESPPSAYGGGGGNHINFPILMRGHVITVQKRKKCPYLDNIWLGFAKNLLRSVNN